MGYLNEETGSWTQSLPLAAVAAPSALFFALTSLSDAPWPGVDSTSFGYGVLTAALALPLFVLCAPDDRGRSSGQWLSIALASFASVLLCLHSGLAPDVLAELDAGGLGWRSLKGASGVFLAALSVPAGLLLGLSKSTDRRLHLEVALPAFAGAAGQTAWFGLVWLVEGAGGIHFWMLSRVLVHTAAGAVAGIAAGGFSAARTASFRPEWGGVDDLLRSRLPGPVFLSALIAVGMSAAGAARISAGLSDTSRLATSRLDEYFLHLSNLHHAWDEHLDYPGLYDSLALSRKAVLGSASFDSRLPALVSPMLDAIERRSSERRDAEALKSAVLAVNRRLLAVGEPYFLEPHTVEAGSWPFRFVLTHTVTGVTRYSIEGGGSVPVLWLRRLDDMPVDTPYTGLSYSGLGTVMLDHVDEVALGRYALLFSKNGIEEKPDESRFAATREKIRQSRRIALENALTRRAGVSEGTLRRLAAVAGRWQGRADPSAARAEMDPLVLAAFDALAGELARQTEMHEARHAFDGDWRGSLAELEDLSPGPLASVAASEIRAFLTELVDGPLGPGFALASVCNSLAGEDARANAYFFAAVVILERLWGEPVRRPDIVSQDVENEPKDVVMPISRDHPGWLSYSRIHGACSDLAALEPDELRRLGRGLFGSLFGEEYRSIERMR